MNPLTTQLEALHEAYVVAVNEAVALDDQVRVDQLTREFDRDALELMGAWLTERPAA